MAIFVFFKTLSFRSGVARPSQRRNAKQPFAVFWANQRIPDCANRSESGRDQSGDAFHEPR